MCSHICMPAFSLMRERNGVHQSEISEKCGAVGALYGQFAGGMERLSVRVSPVYG